jgi:hypothetical protein
MKPVQTFFFTINPPCHQVFSLGSGGCPESGPTKSLAAYPSYHFMEEYTTRFRKIYKKRLRVILFFCVIAGSS